MKLVAENYFYYLAIVWRRNPIRIFRHCVSIDLD